MHTLASTIALSATLTLASAAFSQHVRVISEASGDYGVTWHENLTVWPGQRVDVRVRIALEDAEPFTIVGLSGATYQPTLSGWDPSSGDTVLPFTFPGLDAVGVPTNESEYDGAHVVDTLGATGRIAPFGSGRQGSTSPSGLITAFHDPGNILRFAGSRNTTMLTDVRWGVGTAQYPLSLSGSFFSRDLAPMVFRYAFVVSPRSQLARTLIAQTPFESISGQVAKYYQCSACAQALNMPVLAENLFQAIISVRSRCHADLVGNLQPNPADPTEPPRRLPDGSVTIDDLLYFLEQFELGTSLADLDNASGEGVQDQAVTIDDLLFFLVHFEQGC